MVPDEDMELARKSKRLREDEGETMSKDAQQGAIHTGSSLDDFLEEEGIHKQVEGIAIERVLAWQFEEESNLQIGPGRKAVAKT
jgi:hypothetical protein